MHPDRDAATSPVDDTVAIPAAAGTGSPERVAEPAEPEGGDDDQFEPPASPVDLASHRFPRTLFGYRTQDVDAHLAHLAREWEQLILPSRTAMGIVTAAVERAEGRRPYESLGEDVSGILGSARQAADAARAQGAAELAAAREEVRRTLEALEVERERVHTATHQERERVLVATQQERERILAEAIAENERLRASNAELRARLVGIVDGVTPLLAAAPHLPAPAGQDVVEAPPEAPAEPLPQQPHPSQQGGEDGLGLIESVMAPRPSGGSRKRTR